eukprot:177458-Hanusia_phi.AAC.1
MPALRMRPASQQRRGSCLPACSRPLWACPYIPGGISLRTHQSSLTPLPRSTPFQPRPSIAPCLL